MITNFIFSKPKGEWSGNGGWFGSSAAFVSCVFLLASTAQAQFTGNYALSDFTLTNVGGIFPNGFASSPDCLSIAACPNTNTLNLTGTNDGSGLAGMTDFTVSLPSGDLFGFYAGSIDNTGGAGVLTITNFTPVSSGFQFNYSFAT